MPRHSINQILQTSGNIFDKLPSLALPKPADLRDELDRYLSTDPEYTEDVLIWWFERVGTFPHLSRMALDYLSIPATSVEVERVFSKGRLLLSHVRSRLSAQSTRALLCLGSWSLENLINKKDLSDTTALPEIEADGNEEYNMEEGWDEIGL